MSHIVLYPPTNLLYACLSGQWISPTVSGDCPPPCDFFTLTPLTDDTFVMFGGRMVELMMLKLMQHT